MDCGEEELSVRIEALIVHCVSGARHIQVVVEAKRRGNIRNKVSELAAERPSIYSFI
jgi:hypothetical protein